MHKQIILSLSFLSGFVGMGIQVLLNRWITAVIGASTYTQSTILFTFIFFVGLGAWYYQKLRIKLWHIHGLIGLFSFILFLTWGDSIFVLSPFFNTITNKIIFTFLISAIPGFLMGQSIPLYTHHISQVLKDSYATNFNLTYFLFHLGAGFCLLILEFIFIANFGVGFSILTIAVAASLISIVHLLQKETPLKIERERLLPAYLNKLVFIFGTLSGIFQVALIKTHIHIFGPFPENYTFIIVASLLSLSLASLLAEKFHIKLETWIKHLTLLLTFSLLYIGAVIYLWPYINSSIAAYTQLQFRLFKAVTILSLYIPLFTVFSLLIPCLHNSSYKQTGKMLGLNSFANAFGYLLAIVLLLNFIEMKAILIGVAVAAAFFIFWLQKKVLSWPSMSVSILLLVVWSLSFNSKLFHFSYRFFESPQKVQKMLSSISSIESFRHMGTEVDIIKTDNGSILVIDGYKSVTLNPNNKINRYEMLLGVLQAYFPKKHENSLVLGVGSGITVAGNAMFFKNVNAVEIHPVILQLQDKFKKSNLNLVDKKNVSLIFGDGFNYLINNKIKYDLIVNNVPTPQYSPAANIWTKDFLEKVSSRLQLGGVYSQWIDGAINKKALNVILKTLQSSFSYCYLAVIGHKYNNLICSNEDIEPRTSLKIKDDKRLREELLPINLSELKNFLFKIPNFSQLNFDAQVNSLDKPVLSYVLRSNLEKVWIGKDDWYIFDYLKIKPTADFIERCKTLINWTTREFKVKPPPFCI